MVTLRGLVLNGQGTIALGISIVAASVVHIERCVVHGFAGDGIAITATDAKVFVRDSISRDHEFSGLFQQGPGSSLIIENSRFENNSGGGVAVLSSNATIHRSTVSGNDGGGIHASNAAVVSVVSTVAARNDFHGFSVSFSGVMTVESSVADGNAANGLFASVGGDRTDFELHLHQ